MIRTPDLEEFGWAGRVCGAGTPARELFRLHRRTGVSAPQVGRHLPRGGLASAQRFSSLSMISLDRSGVLMMWNIFHDFRRSVLEDTHRSVGCFAGFGDMPGATACCLSRGRMRRRHAKTWGRGRECPGSGGLPWRVRPSNSARAAKEGGFSNPPLEFLHFWPAGEPEDAGIPKGSELVAGGGAQRHHRRRSIHHQHPGRGARPSPSPSVGSVLHRFIPRSYRFVRCRRLFRTSPSRLRRLAGRFRQGSMFPP